MTTRKFLMIVAVCLIALVAFGTVSAQEATSIRFGTVNDPNINKVIDMLVEAFKADHPDVEVNIEYLTGDYSDALAAQAVAGTLPDVVFTADLFIVPWVQNNILLDMQAFAEADEDVDINDVYPLMLDLGRVAGDPGLYMIPSSYDVVTVYYNKTMFEAAGAPLPEADWTWDDMIAACSIIVENTDNFCLPGPGTHNWWAWYVPWIQGYGGSLLSEDGRTAMLNSPETLAGLSAYVSMWTDLGLNQPLDFDAGGNCFDVGKCALDMTIAGKMGALRALDPQPFEWDVQVIPSLPEGKFTGMGTYGFAVTTSSPNPELAWDFVKNLITPDIQKAIALNYAGTPLLQSMAEDPDILNRAAPPENIDAFRQNGENGILPTYFPGECGSLYAGQISQEITDAFEAALLGAASVEDAFNQANQNIQDCLDMTIE